MTIKINYFSVSQNQHLIYCTTKCLWNFKNVCVVYIVKEVLPLKICCGLCFAKGSMYNSFDSLEGFERFRNL